MNAEENTYYEQVGAYYDEDASLGFEDRAEANASLQRIREAFRTYVERLKPENALEIGCGPGFDAEWFAQRFPDSRITAVDVSANMVELAAKRTAAFPNASAQQATEKDIATLPNAPFDAVFVFFGALNTVESLPRAADAIYQALDPGGHAVLTFVNKWYLRELLVNLLKLRFKTAFARIRKVWGGYSVSRFLPSHCYSPAQVRAAFHAFDERTHEGFSIAYPAWYNHAKLRGNQAKADRLWQLDRRLNNTMFWQHGEYTLFVFRKPLH